MKKNSDYRKGLDKLTNRQVENAENVSEHLDRLMSIPAQDLFSNKTEWVKEHEV